ncbi:MAG: hypothetical protein H6Q11_656 [Acidobacteria bacterium]|nr:hypothetical protein [Acidobacteriota bacterium]
MSIDSDYTNPGPLLGLFMRRRGWSAARLAEIAGGVSASSVRAYTADRSTPRPSQALAVARALGAQDGRRMLESWGYADLAEGFSEDQQRAANGFEGRPAAGADPRGNRIEYVGEPLSEAGIALVRSILNWVQSIEVTARDRKLI